MKDSHCMTIAAVIMTCVLALSFTTADANQRVYMGVGTIICETEDAAMQILASDLEYDGTKGNCVLTDRPISAIDLGKCGFLNPICAYDIGGLIVYAHESWIKR